MVNPIFLTVAQVTEIHADQIARYGGSLELRDSGLLESAVATPQAQFGGEFLHPTWADMAGAYLFHLVMNHAFVDGNKRTGAVAARVFLLMNDVAFDPPEAEYESMTLAVASGEATKEDAIAFIRKHVAESFH